jgi:hypothetical protein
LIVGLEHGMHDYSTPSRLSPLSRISMVQRLRMVLHSPAVIQA